MRRIQFIGLDMDHTLVRYNIPSFEKAVFKMAVEYLIRFMNYPEELKNFRFHFDRVTRGLVIDTHQGNFLKLSRYRAIRVIYHGQTQIDYNKRREIYPVDYIPVDAEQSRFFFIESHFQVAMGHLFMQLVELKKTKKTLPSYQKMFDDVQVSLHKVHSDGSLKGYVSKNISQYIKTNPLIALCLERFIQHGKKLFLLTNSDIHYCLALMDHTITPFLKEHSSWQDLFEIVITSADKPLFFHTKKDFEKIEKDTLKVRSKIEVPGKGLYQYGSAEGLTRSFKAVDDEILYIGDQVYTDVVLLKQKCGWRTALVIEELEKETQIIDEKKPKYKEIKNLMNQKIPIENEMNHLISEQIENNHKKYAQKIQNLISKTEKLDQQLSAQIQSINKDFNPFWGELMRVGLEESLFASQAERFSCIYAPKLLNILSQSPRTYYRASKRLFPHEF